MPRRLATSRAMVLLPEPAGPSMAMIIVPPDALEIARTKLGIGRRRCSPASSIVVPSRGRRPGDRSGHGHPVVRLGRDAAARPAVRVADDVHAVGMLHHLDAQGPEQGGHGPQPVALLGPQFGGPAQARDALGLGGRQQEQGQLVDDVRAPRRAPTSVATRSEVRAVMRPTGSGPDVPAGLDLDRRRPCARRTLSSPVRVGLRPDVLDGHLRVRRSAARPRRRRRPS